MLCRLAMQVHAWLGLGTSYNCNHNTRNFTHHLMYQFLPRVVPIYKENTLLNFDRSGQRSWSDMAKFALPLTTQAR